MSLSNLNGVGSMNIGKDQKIFLIIISVLSLIVIPLVFFALLKKEFKKSNFKETIEIELNEEWKRQSGTICYGNFFSCEEVNVAEEGEIDTTKLGSYKVKYTYSYNEKTETLEQTVIVVDKIPPVLEIKEEEFFYCENGNIPKYTVRAIDNYDGDITENIVSVVENGKIVFQVSDSSKNQTKVERDATIKDNESPVLTLIGEKEIRMKVNDPYIENGANAVDTCDGDITEKIEIEGNVDVKQPGKYTLTYKVKDRSGNLSSETRTVVIESEKKVLGKKIYLTFDDGPGKYTAKLLDILKKYNAKATFFVTNQNLTKGYDDIILRAYREGHTIGLHTFSHDYAIYQSVDTYLNDLYAIQEKVKKITGYTSKIIRFPGGSSNTISKSYDNGSHIMSKLTKEVTDRGFRYYDWNILSGDAGETKDPNKIFYNVIEGFDKFTTPIVLQHDIKDYSVNAMEKILEYGTKHGYEFSCITSDTPLVQHRVNN